MADLTLLERITGKSVVDAGQRKAWSLAGAGPGSGWQGNGWRRILEPFTGAWQRNIEINATRAAANWAVFSCVKLIANDIGKMPAMLMQYSDTLKVWEKQAGFATLDNPNAYQTWPDFMRFWMYSLLLRGNTYVLPVVNKKTGFIDAMYILDPGSVRPLVTPSGDVYYRIGADILTGVDEATILPASSIMHDRINPLYHPLIGLSPLYACGLAAMQGIEIQTNSTNFFKNASRPGGILTAPGEISDDTAKRLKDYWDDNFTGNVAGKIAVLGDGLKFEAMAMTAEDSQLIEQLKMTGEMICAAFGVPAYKLGLGSTPPVGSQAAMAQLYYDQCLHPYIDSIERHLDAGLNVIYPRQIWLDTSELLRMDQAARYASYEIAVRSGLMAPNEARQKEQLPPVSGGESPYLQQQNFSLAALAKRDAKEDPFASAPAGNADVAAPPVDATQIDASTQTGKGMKVAFRKEDIPMCTAFFDKQLEVTRGV